MQTLILFIQSIQNFSLEPSSFQGQYISKENWNCYTFLMWLEKLIIKKAEKQLAQYRLHAEIIKKESTDSYSKYSSQITVSNSGYSYNRPPESIYESCNAPLMRSFYLPHEKSRHKYKDYQTQ